MITTQDTRDAAAENRKYRQLEVRFKNLIDEYVRLHVHEKVEDCRMLMMHKLQQLVQSGADQRYADRLLVALSGSLAKNILVTHSTLPPLDKPRVSLQEIDRTLRALKKQKKAHAVEAAWWLIGKQPGWYVASIFNWKLREAKAALKHLAAKSDNSATLAA